MAQAKAQSFYISSCLSYSAYDADMIVRLRLPNNIDFICPNIDIEYCPKSPKYCQYIDNIDLETAPNIDNILNIDSGISAQILNILKY